MSDEKATLTSNTVEAYNTIKKILVEQLGLEVEEIAMDVDLVDDLGLESIDAIDAIAALEESLGVSIQVREFMGVRTVGDLVRMVTEIRAKRAGSRP